MQDVSNAVGALPTGMFPDPAVGTMAGYVKILGLLV
jgi:hypothetical protein